MKKLFLFAAAMATTLCVNAETINNHAYVDLGLPSGLRWATMNVGATAPEEYGDYYAWGEIATKITYDWSVYKYADESFDALTKYCDDAYYGKDGFTDDLTTLTAADDVATQKWGGNWRMPTNDEWQELIDNCDWTWTTLNGVNGYEVKATNGNSIFLPAASFRDVDAPYNAGSDGHYWSSSLYTSGPCYAQYVNFDSDSHNTYRIDRYCGLSVRAVVMFYGITIAATTNGSVEAVKDAYAGQEVALTIKPDAGYELESVSVKDANDNDVTVTGNTFTMPAGAVTVTATFKKPDTKEYVDLGLPSGLRWATCNVGASAPEIYGNYYAWGEITTKESYTWENYTLANRSSTTLTKYNNSSSYGTVDNKTTLEAADDAATQNWGGNWRMPTKDEWQELIDNCTWTWTTKNSVNGYQVKATNGNSIFLPAAGFRNNDELDYVDSDGGYWSSSLYTNSSNYAQNVGFDSEYHDTDFGFRYGGLSVRPVVMFYGITIAAATNGSVEAVKDAYAGQEVALTIKPDAGYELGSITVKDADDNDVTVTEDNKFTMPAGAVTVTATFKKPDPKEYVDLGLPSGLRWATTNVGATNPEDYGDYYAWGEIAPKTTYAWENYTLANGSSTTLTKYNNSSSYGTVDNKTTLEAADDAATQIWGGAWRMPTLEELDELERKCTWTWTTLNGVNGYEVKATNGNSIFLPAAGYRNDGVLEGAGSFGAYWLSSLFSVDPSYAHCADFGSDYHDIGSEERRNGQSVRPVIMFYGITITAATNGSVEAVKDAYAGQEVALTIKPDAGYELESITVKDADDNDVTLSADNKFTMPAGAVTVSATFKATTATALQSVEMAEIYANNGTIYGAEGMQIFTLTGQNVTEMNGQLNGVYIVKVGNAAQKIVVR